MTPQQRKKFKHLIAPINLADFKSERAEQRKTLIKSEVKLKNNVLKDWTTVQTDARETRQIYGGEEIGHGDLKRKKDLFILSDFDARIHFFIEALFHCWGFDDETQKVNGKIIRYIEAEEFYKKMAQYGFTIDTERFEEVANIAYENRPVEKLPV